MYITDKDGKIIGLTAYNDKKWDELVSQLSVDVVADFLADGGLATNAIDSIGKPPCVDSDGPSGFNTTIFGSDQFGGYAASYPCEVMVASTWNWRMAYRMGKSVGAEGEAAGIDGWYVPRATCIARRTAAETSSTTAKTRIFRASCASIPLSARKKRACMRM